MKSMITCPWELNSPGIVEHGWVRYKYKTTKIVAFVYKSIQGWYYGATHLDRDPAFSGYAATEEAAKKLVDDYLLEGGFYLIKESVGLFR